MALINCSSCGQRVSSQWPECPSCGTRRGGAGKGGRRRFNAQPHYLIGSVLATIGALIYGGQLVAQAFDTRLMTVAMGMMAVGAGWYAAARLIVLVLHRR